MFSNLLVLKDKIFVFLNTKVFFGDLSQIAKGFLFYINLLPSSVLITFKIFSSSPVFALK